MEQAIYLPWLLEVLAALAITLQNVQRLSASLGPALLNNRPLQRKQDQGQRGEALANDNLPSDDAPGSRELRGLPWAWIALCALATLVWIAGVGWVAIKLLLWLFD